MFDKPLCMSSLSGMKFCDCDMKVYNCDMNMLSNDMKIDNCDMNVFNSDMKQLTDNKRFNSMS